jgi:putative nucleotidyltransferase with HDIG domain
MTPTIAWNPERARQLMHEWTASPALRVHMECVAACTAAYARKLAPADVDRWFIAGLLHDFDYEKHPSAEEHPVVGVAHLASIGVDEDIRRAILAHAPRTGETRSTPIAKALFACDELAGFLVACSKVRPDGFATLEPSSVKKKLKNKAFAAAVSRDDIAVGTRELAELLAKDAATFEDEHFQTCIDAIKSAAPTIGI